MICPQCKAEYRQGFTVCADCDVPLVTELRAASSPSREWAASDQIAEPADDPFCAFWNGEDPRIHAELCGLLDEQGIPHKTIRRADHLFNLNSRSAFQIGIPFSFFEKAEAAIKEAYGSDDEIQPASSLLPPGTDHLPGTRKGLTGLDDRLRSARAESESHPESAITALPEQSSSWGNAEVSRADWDPQNWYPENATVEVWSGDQPELGEMIAASLQENQIHSRPSNSAGNCALFVLPGDEACAREIVREIVEGAPPE
jgi:hypothetical protein